MQNKDEIKELFENSWLVHSINLVPIKLKTHLVYEEFINTLLTKTDLLFFPDSLNLELNNIRELHFSGQKELVKQLIQGLNKDNKYTKEFLHKLKELTEQ